MGVFVWWLERGAKEPPELVDQAFRGLAAHGMSLLSPAHGDPA